MAKSKKAQLASQVRNDLKAELGLTSRDVSVRSRWATYSIAIDVTIKRAGIDKAAVEAIANRVKSIDRCAVSGEILGGGNRYVSVDWCRDLVRAITDPAKKALSDLLADPTTPILYGTDGCLELGISEHSKDFYLYNLATDEQECLNVHGNPAASWNVGDAAYRLARHILEAA